MTEFLTTYGLWLVIALLIVIAITYLMSSKASADKATGDNVQADTAEPQRPTEAQPEIAPPPVVVTTTPVPPVIDPIPAAAPPPSVVIDPTPANAAPVPVAKPAPAPATGAAPSEGTDNLLQLKGVGPKLTALLTDLGVTRFAQIAAWTETDIAAIDAKLGNFKGRPVRDQWIDQAKYLANGDIAGFEAKYGKL